MARMYRVTIAPTAPDAGARWRATCTCSWAEATSTRDASAPLGAQHMREQHRGQGYTWLNKRSHIEVFGLDERLLDKPEQAAYAKLAAGAVHLRGGVADPVTNPLQLAGMRWFLLFAVVTMGIFFILIGSEATDSTITTYALGALALLAVVTPCLCLSMATQNRTLARRRATAYLRSIGFPERTAPAPAQGASQSSGPTTRRSEQRAWYGENSHMDWRHRAQAEIYGLDADTYRSNMLEHDKD